MGRHVLKDCFIEVDAIDFSDHCSSVVVNDGHPAVDANTFGLGRSRLHGLADNSFVLNLDQDFDAAKVDATLSPLVGDEDGFDVKVRPTSAAASATNPEYTGTCKLFEYTPLSGEVGSRHNIAITLPVEGEIARGTGS